MKHRNLPRVCVDNAHCMSSAVAQCIATDDIHRAASLRSEHRDARTNLAPESHSAALCASRCGAALKLDVALATQLAAGPATGLQTEGIDWRTVNCSHVRSGL